MVRVAVVSAIPAVRAGLRTLLSQRASIEVTREASGSADLESLETVADVIVLDVDPTDLSRIVALANQGGVGLVLLGGEVSEIASLARGSPGAWAAIPRDAEIDEIAAAIEAVASGLIALSPAALMGLVRQEASEEVSLQRPNQTLSAREKEILQLMAEGLPNKQIAARLGVSLHTVKFHAAALFAKLDVASRTEAVTEGVRRGLVLL